MLPGGGLQPISKVGALGGIGEERVDDHVAYAGFPAIELHADQVFVFNQVWQQIRFIIHDQVDGFFAREKRRENRNAEQQKQHDGRSQRQFVPFELTEHDGPVTLAQFFCGVSLLIRI